jgi:hypothetical protein
MAVLLLPFLGRMDLPIMAFPKAIEIQAVAADASLLLLVGGLAMLCCIMLLVAVQNLVPEKTPIGGPTRIPRGGTEALPRLWPRRPRKVASGLPVDKAMARIVHVKLGEPRILQARLHTTRVRLFGCPGCAFEVEDGGDGKDGKDGNEGKDAPQGCGRERLGLEQAFKDVFGPRVAAWEIACRRRGDEACDFEVKH